MRRRKVTEAGRVRKWMRGGQRTVKKKKKENRCLKSVLKLREA